MSTATKPAPAKKIRQPRPTDATGLQLLPGADIRISEGGRGWHGVLVCAGRTEPRVGDGLGAHMYCAALNYMRVPDFCGGAVIGCVNSWYRDIDDTRALQHIANNPQIQALPLLQPVPDELWEKFHNAVPSRDHVWPLVGLFHYLISHYFMQHGPAMITAWDRTTGLTYKRTLAACGLLQGRHLKSDKYNLSASVPYLQSVRVLKPYVNLNSSQTVAGVSIRLNRIIDTTPLRPCQKTMETVMTVPGNHYAPPSGRMVAPWPIESAYYPQH